MAKAKKGTLKSQLDRQRKKVDVDQFDVTLREIVRMTHAKELHRAPVYQRKFRWEERDESRLIESLFLGLPVPNIFVAANDDGTWELVDGLQRVSTIIHFVGEPESLMKEIDRPKPLRLDHLEILSRFNDKTFQELPLPIQLIFYKRSLRMTVLSDKSDPDVRFDMFDRLNSGALALTAQEIRACIYSGRFVEFLREMAGNESFNSLLKLQKSKQNNGTKEELVLKFFAYLARRNEFTSSVKSFLNDFAEEAKEGFDYEAGKPLFEEVAKGLAEIVKGPVLRKDGSVTPLNELEAIMVAYGELKKEGKPITVPPPTWLDDPDLLKFSTAGTNSKQMLNGRVNRAKQLLSGT